MSSFVSVNLYYEKKGNSKSDINNEYKDIKDCQSIQMVYLKFSNVWPMVLSNKQEGKV